MNLIRKEREACNCETYINDVIIHTFFKVPVPWPIEDYLRSMYSVHPSYVSMTFAIKTQPNPSGTETQKGRPSYPTPSYRI